MRALTLRRWRERRGCKLPVSQELQRHLVSWAAGGRVNRFWSAALTFAPRREESAADRRLALGHGADLAPLFAPGKAECAQFYRIRRLRIILTSASAKSKRKPVKYDHNTLIDFKMTLASSAHGFGDAHVQVSWKSADRNRSSDRRSDRRTRAERGRRHAVNLRSGRRTDQRSLWLGRFLPALSRRMRRAGAYGRRRKSDAEGDEGDRARQPVGQFQHHADVGSGTLGRRRPVGLSERRQGRSRGLCAFETQAPDRGGPAPPSAAHDGRERPEQRWSRRADGEDQQR